MIFTSFELFRPLDKDWGRKISHQQEEGKEFQKQLQKYINALRTLTFERSRLLDLLLCGYPSAWGQKDKLKLSKIEQEAAVENACSKLNYDTMSKLGYCHFSKEFNLTVLQGYI